MYTNNNECEDFTEKELIVVWEKLIQRYKDRPNLQSTLSRNPRLDEECELILDIENSVQQDLINSVKPELVSWLRRELKNSKIHLVTKINHTEKGKVIYTDSEKFDEMIRINPELKLLKERLHLDFE